VRSLPPSTTMTCSRLSCPISWPTWASTPTAPSSTSPRSCTSGPPIPMWLPWTTTSS